MPKRQSLNSMTRNRIVIPAQQLIDEVHFACQTILPRVVGQLTTDH
jgi:hypothetical protein